MLSKEQKKVIMGEYQRSGGDSGSPEVQIALLSENISVLQKHFASHKKDHSSRRGLIRMVNQRRNLLNYLKKSDPQKYLQIIKRLGLRR